MKLVIKHGDEFATTSQIVAANTDNEHASVMKLVRDYQGHIEQFGLVRFEIAPRAKGQHGGGDVQFAILNEQQSTFLLTLMRNTEIVVRFKVELVKEFYRLRKEGVAKRNTIANPTNATRAHLLVVSMMQKIGVRKEMAMAVALQAIHEDTGLTTEPYRLALPSVEEPANLNQTQLGELLGIKSRAVGDILRDAGLMIKDESGNRVVTELGRKHGEMKPFSRNGHSGYEPRWNKSVLDVLRSTSDIA